MSSAWGLILRWSITIKVSTELPGATSNIKPEHTTAINKDLNNIYTMFKVCRLALCWHLTDYSPYRIGDRIRLLPPHHPRLPLCTKYFKVMLSLLYKIKTCTFIFKILEIFMELAVNLCVEIQLKRTCSIKLYSCYCTKLARQNPALTFMKSRHEL